MFLGDISGDLARFAGGRFLAHLAAEEPGGANQRGLVADFQGVWAKNPETKVAGYELSMGC